MDKEQLTPENAISKIRWYTDMLDYFPSEFLSSLICLLFADNLLYVVLNLSVRLLCHGVVMNLSLCELFIWKEVLF